MGNSQNEGSIFCIGMVLGLAIGVIIMLISVSILMDHYRTNAIKNGAAEYNRVTGEFQWITKEEQQ